MLKWYFKTKFAKLLPKPDEVPQHYWTISIIEPDKVRARQTYTDAARDKQRRNQNKSISQHVGGKETHVHSARRRQCENKSISYHAWEREDTFCWSERNQISIEIQPLRKKERFQVNFKIILYWMIWFFY